MSTAETNYATDQLSPFNLVTGRRVKTLVTGLIAQRTALVTGDKDRFGWCVLRVDGPPGDSLLGVDLRCEDYVPIEYLDEPQDMAGAA